MALVTRNSLERSIKISNEVGPVHVNVPYASLDEIFDRAIEQWKTENPFEALVAFPRHIQELRAIHPDGKAYNQDKVWYFIGDTPRRLRTIIGDLLGNQDWEFDREVVKRWWTRFKAGRITPDRPLPEHL